MTFEVDDLVTIRYQGHSTTHKITGKQGGSFILAPESNECTLCGKPTAAPGCPLCPDCAEEQETLEQDARDEKEQRRRPL